MKHHAIVACLCLVAVAFVSSAAAQENPAIKRFEQWDANGDKTLTVAEFPEKIRGRFGEMDTNEDDAVSREEMLAFLERRKNPSPREDADRGSRQPMISEEVSPIEELKIDENTYAALRKPPGEGPFPAVIFLHGGLGRSNLGSLRNNSLHQLTSAHFLSFGYVTVNATRRSIAHDPGDRGVVEDTLKVIEAIKAMPEVDAKSVVLYGGSGGGTLAMELAGETELAAVAAGEPATIIYMGMFTKAHVITDDDGNPKGDRRNDVMGGDAKELYTDELRQFTRKKMAKIQCPILILHGDKHPLKKFNFDVVVPELKALEKEVELIIYPGENHGFYWGKSANPAMPLKAIRDADAFFQKHIATQPMPIKPEEGSK